LVETSVVYPLIRGRDVSPWKAEPSQFIIVPHDPTEFGRVLTARDLSSAGRFQKAGSWLRSFRPVLRGRRGPPNRNWNMNGDDWCRIEGPLAHMRGEHLVLVREIAGRPAAAVVDRRYIAELGRSEAPLVDHKLLFCSVPSREEALYLVAFINSTPAQDFLRSYANTTGVTPRAIRTLPIPPFDRSNDLCERLATQGSVIVALPPDRRAEEAEAVKGDIDEVVVLLGQLDPTTYAPQPRSRRRRRRADVTQENSPLPGFE
jgi:hypothetical protein